MTTHTAAEAMRGVDFAAATRAVRALTRETPLLESPALSQRVGGPAYVKLECLQVTGSFKARGAAARLTALGASGRERGVVACSSGNHGRAVAYVAERLGIPATVYVPSWVDPVKLAGIRGHGAEAVLFGDTYDEAEAEAVAVATRDGRPFVSAYDDPWVIAGQGTLGPEILRQLGEAPAAILVPLSGGGLVGGIAASLRGEPPDREPTVVAVSAQNAAVMRASVEAGHPVELPEEPTLANALAGGIGLDNRFSFPLIRDLIRVHVTVTEDEIADAMSFAYKELHVIVEGGGAVGLAALLSGRWTGSGAPGGPTVVVVSGGNVDLATLQRVVGAR